MSITFGLSLQHSGGAALEERGTKFARALSEALGAEVEAVISPTYRAQLSGLVAREIDVAWLPPLSQQEAMAAGARLVAVPLRNGWMTFRCAVLVRMDAPWLTFRDLKGARAAWRDKSSASGYLFPRLELAALGVKPEVAFSDEKFLGTTVGAAEAVVAGEADVCTCFVSEMAATDRAVAQREVANALGRAGTQLRVLHVTDSIPPDGFVVGAHVTNADAIAAGLHKLHLKPAGKDALQVLLQAERLTPVNDAILRSLQSWAAIAQARAV